MSQLKIILYDGYKSNPLNTCRNIEATMKASRKTLQDKEFIFLGKKNIFTPKWQYNKKKYYSPKSLHW